MAERFSYGDMVVWVGPGDFGTRTSPFVVGEQYKIIDTDPGDGFPYYLSANGDFSGLGNYWVRDEDVGPAKPPLPAPPKFQTLDEAEAWLEAHGPDKPVVTEKTDPFDPGPRVGFLQYVVTVTRREQVTNNKMESVEVFRSSTHIMRNAPDPVRSALLIALATYDEQPF